MPELLEVRVVRWRKSETCLVIIFGCKNFNYNLEQHKLFAKMVDKMKGLTKGGKMPNPQNMAKLANAVPPQVLRQMGGLGGLNNLMKQMGDMNFNIPGFK